jgi:peptidoglycan/LPS O-acetylase OafA/YrhL
MSCVVMVNHYAFFTCQQWNTFITPIMAVQSFFCISGFLIVRSYYNSRSLKKYLEKRARRILPAYLFIVVLCGLGLVFVSDLPVKEYFTSTILYKYLAANLTFLNFLQPYLPGVFTESRDMVVNSSLWTIKIEISLYLLVPFIVYFIRRFDKRIICFLIYASALFFYRYMDYLYSMTGNRLYEILSRQFLSQLAFFISGAFLFYYFDFFKKYRYLFFSISLPVIFFSFNKYVYFFYPFALAISIFFLAFSLPVFNKAGKYGDFSYGIYLFHVPVIQTLLFVRFYDKYNNWMFPAVILITFLLSFLSWNLIEKIFLNKSRLKR